MVARYSHNQVIDWFIIRDIELISTSADEDFSEQPRCSFIAVDKPVIANRAMQHSGRFLRNLFMISRIRSRQCRFYQVQATDPGSPAISQRLIMRSKGVSKRQSIVPPTDRPTASKQRSVLRTHRRLQRLSFPWPWRRRSMCVRQRCAQTLRAAALHHPLAALFSLFSASQTSPNRDHQNDG